MESVTAGNCRRMKKLETGGRDMGGNCRCYNMGEKQDVHRCGEDLLGWD